MTRRNDDDDYDPHGISTENPLYGLAFYGDKVLFLFNLPIRIFNRHTNTHLTNECDLLVSISIEFFPVSLVEFFFSMRLSLATKTTTTNGFV